jgi:hypothetical protein
MPDRTPQNQLRDGYYSIGKVLYNRLGRVVMEDVCRDFGWEWSPEQAAAYRVYLDGVLEEYRANQARRTPEQIAEENYEMLAAFGPGVKVVNIITGKEHTT